MNVEAAIKKIDALKINIGVLENRRNDLLGSLKAKFGTDNISELTAIRDKKKLELDAAVAEKARLEGELDLILSGV